MVKSSVKPKGKPMPRKWTLSECFDFYNVKPDNPRWSWSARSEDGKVVVLTLWQDKFSRKGGIMVYEDIVDEAPKDWSSFPGNAERLRNLEWAREHCNGDFRVVIAIPKDRNAPIRKISECFPKPELRMRIVDWDEETGSFRAVAVNADDEH